MKFSRLVSTIFLVTTFVCLLLFGFIFWFYSSADSKTIIPLKDSLSTSSSFFGGITTLIAAYIASKLFNDWRDEKRFEIETNLLQSILSELKPIYTELIKIRSDSNNLKHIDKCLIVKTSYLEGERLDIFKSLINLYPNIKIYSHFKNDGSLTDLYNRFDKHCFCFLHFYEELFLKRYRIYYERVLSDNRVSGEDSSLKHYNIIRKYSDTRKRSLIIDINEILNIFQKDQLRATIGDITVITTYDDWLDETIELHNQIQEYCMNGLKIPE
ncbi:hypothetical protein D3C72_160570 [compost metagenome]